MEVLVLGATGSLGRHLVDELVRRGHRVRAASRKDREGEGTAVRWVRVDVAAGVGVTEAVEGADALIDAANVRSGRRSALDAVHVHGTRRVLDACHRSGDVHYVGISIVGIDDIAYVYYRAKVRQEQVVEAAPGPWTLLRATQFHDLADAFLGAAARLPALPLPTAMQLQTIDARDVARRLVDLAEQPAAGRMPDIGGPQVQTLGELASQWQAATGRSKRVLRVPMPGRTGRALAAGVLCAPDGAVAGRTFAGWLAERYGTGRAETRPEGQAGS